MSSKKNDDVEMKDAIDTSSGAKTTNTDEKKEEPYDPFFGKLISICSSSFFHYRVQEGDGTAWKGWQR